MICGPLATPILPNLLGRELADGPVLGRSANLAGLEALLRIVGLIVIGVTVSAVDGACSCI